MPKHEGPKLIEPPRWSEEQLRAGADASLGKFIAERAPDARGVTRGGSEYERLFHTVEPDVRRLFALTSELRKFDAAFLEKAPDLISAARFLCGPPVSEDDLKTLVGGGVKKRPQAVVDVVRAAWDPIRFPWVKAGRPPTPEERERAILWTCGVWAIERCRTLARGSASRRQERAVRSALEAVGYRPEPGLRRQNILTVDAVPKGTFVPGECWLGGTKCDVLARLRDGRLLAVECKVSNSTVNSFKRLNKDAVRSASDWKRAFATQVVVCAVLAGVFKLENLVRAQAEHQIFIVWEHDLAPLREFVAAKH